MRRRIAVLCFVILLAVIGAAVPIAANQETTAAPVVTVRIPANQSIEVDCLGDELIIVTNEAGDKALITCRVWFGVDR